MEEHSELPQIPKMKGGRPRLYATKEEKLAGRRIPIENQKPIGRPRKFSTTEGKIESQRKTPQEYEYNSKHLSLKMYKSCLE